MAFMMGGGIWLRSSGMAPDEFIAVFYTGLRCALALVGVLFWIFFAKEKMKSALLRKCKNAKSRVI